MWWSATAIILAAVIYAIYSLNWRLPRKRGRLTDSLRLADFQAQRDTAAEHVRQATDAVVREYVVAYLNEVDAPAYRGWILVGDGAGSAHELTRAVGLSEVHQPGHEVDTDARTQVLRRLVELPGGSFGISGPRGVGKSTLLRSICDTNPDIAGQRALAINTAAPVEYEAREFLLHLFSSLCRQVLQTQGAKEEALTQEEALREARTWQARTATAYRSDIGRVLLLAGALAVVIGIAAAAVVFRLNAPDLPYVSAASNAASAGVRSGASAHVGVVEEGASGGGQSTRKEQTNAAPVAASPSRRATSEVLGILPGALLLFGAVCVVLGTAVLVEPALNPWRRFLSRGQPRATPHLVARSLEELRNIRFQRSYTSGWSGGLKMPVGLEAGLSGGLTIAQHPESLPELVLRYRTYVQMLVREYGRVIIGIDELDKLRSPKEAETFLNGVKSVFGIDGCFYLISVSEQALSAFERRGLGFRDAFDSALDDVCQVSYASLDGSRALLARRILRLPDPFLHLCHMLSGGLPRDLIRHVRGIIELAAKRGAAGLTIADAADALVRSELDGKIRATSIALRQLDDDTVTERLVLIAELGLYTSIPELSTRIRKFRDEIAPRPEGRATLLCRELATYADLLVAVQTVAAEGKTKAGWTRSRSLSETELIAAARQSIEVSPALASAALERWRQALFNHKAAKSAPAQKPLARKQGA